MPKRIVPKDVLERHVKNYEELKAKFPGVSRMANGTAQFVYNGETFTLKKQPNTSTGWQAVPAWREARDAASRRGKAKAQKIKLSSIEQMMVDNYYREAARRGLVVDHIDPIAKGAPSNAPWNLQLLQDAVNAEKSDQRGGYFPREPFLVDQFTTGEDLAIRSFGFPEEIQQGATTTAPSGSYTPIPLGGIDFSRIPQQTKTPPMTKIPPVTVMESNGKENGNGNGNGNGYPGSNGNGNGNGNGDSHADIPRMEEILAKAKPYLKSAVDMGAAVLNEDTAKHALQAGVGIAAGLGKVVTGSLIPNY